MRKFLEKQNVSILQARTGEDGLKLAAQHLPDVITLDVMMPEISGTSFLDYFRGENTNVPVIMLTANNQLDIKTKSYILGCDDYLSKPFEPMELVLRIKKLLNPRVNSNKSEKKYYFGDFSYEFNTKQLNKNNRVIKLTSSEEYLLEILLKNINKEISRELLAEKLNLDKNLRSVDVIVTRLRKKITSSSNISFLKTVRGKGYKLVSEYE